MDTQEFQRYLETRYRNQIQWYDDKARSNQRWHRIMQAIIIVLTATTPIAAIGHIQWITIVLATSVAIATSLARLYKFEENWISYRTTCELLRKEEFLMRAGLQDYGNDRDSYSTFVQRVENLISRENTFWVTTNQKQNRSQGSTREM